LRNAKSVTRGIQEEKGKPGKTEGKGKWFKIKGKGNGKGLVLIPINPTTLEIRGKANSGRGMMRVTHSIITAYCLNNSGGGLKKKRATALAESVYKSDLGSKNLDQRHGRGGKGFIFGRRLVMSEQEKIQSAMLARKGEESGRRQFCRITKNKERRDLHHVGEEVLEKVSTRRNTGGQMPEEELGKLRKEGSRIST